MTMCACCGTDDRLRARNAALEADVERLREDVAQLSVDIHQVFNERDRFATECDNLCAVLAEMEAHHIEHHAERDRLRAVLAETPENIEALAQLFYSRLMVSYDVDWESAAKSSCRSQARAVLAHLRARAGMEPTP